MYARASVLFSFCYDFKLDLEMFFVIVLFYVILMCLVFSFSFFSTST